MQGYLPTGVELHVRGRPITLVDLATQTSGLPRLPKGLVRSSLRRRSNPYAGFGVEQQRGPLSQGLGWAGLPLRGHPQRMLWHNGGTGGFRSFAGFVKETRAGVVVLANSSRSVDAIGFRLLEAVADLSGLRPELPARTTDDRNNVVTTPLH